MQPKKIGIGIVVIIVIGIIATAVGDSSVGAPSNAVVNNAPGSSTPGCEPDCFIPTTTTIRAGGTITWMNGDTAAHTATAGTATDGPSGVWDSGLIMTGGSYSYTADTAGTFDYFCMVHPWMSGVVIIR